MTVYQSIATFIAHAPATGIDRYENKMYLLTRSLASRPHGRRRFKNVFKINTNVLHCSDIYFRFVSE